MKDAYKKNELKQVVGHTVVPHIDIVADKYFFVDAQETKEYLTLSEDGYQIRHY
jgi:hypothetical protein